jgi:hypothetical protein
MLSRPQGNSAAGRLTSIEKYNDLIGKRTRELPACSIVPQPTMLQLAPFLKVKVTLRLTVSQSVSLGVEPLITV